MIFLVYFSAYFQEARRPVLSPNHDHFQSPTDSNLPLLVRASLSFNLIG